MRKSLVTAAVVAGLFGAGAANAAFILQDTAAPNQQTIAIPTNNDFRTQLGTAGATGVTTSASLALSAPGTVTASYWGKEAQFTNQFLWAGSPVFTTGGPGVDSWGTASANVQSRQASTGVLNFSFCALTTSQCLTNQQNDSQGATSAQNIGFFLAPGGSTAWLLWDDGGGVPGDDNDYDDMIVRLTVQSASVPEPATLGLLGLGLLGAGVAARRRRKA